MFVTNWISTTKIQKISEITNFFRHYFLSRTEVLSVLLSSYSEKGKEKPHPINRVRLYQDTSLYLAEEKRQFKLQI